MTTETRPRVLYHLHPKQQEAMSLLGLTPERFEWVQRLLSGQVTEGQYNAWLDPQEPVEELLYGGEAGGGKSFLIRAAAATICLLWPSSTVVIFRQTYSQLHDTHIKMIRRGEWPEELGKYNDERKEFIWRNGSLTQFRYCETDSDAYRYDSAEWEALFVDEATDLSQDTLEYLRTRVRSPKPGWRAVQLYGTNPTGIGHAFLKREFVDMAPSGTKWLAKIGEGETVRRCFLRARLGDNPSLNEREYRRRIVALRDDTLRRALLEGDWDVFSGQYFKEWRRNLHVCDPFTIPDDWLRYGAADYGFADPCAAVWVAEHPETKRLYVYREFYKKGMRDEEQAKKIKELSGDERIRAWILDPSMFNTRRERNQRSIATIYRRAGLRRLLGASNERISGWQALRAMLAWEQNEKTGTYTKLPRLQVFSTCLNLIRTLPEQQHHPINVEDLAETVGSRRMEEHLVDCLRYLAMALSGKFAKIRVKEVEFGS